MPPLGSEALWSSPYGCRNARYWSRVGQEFGALARLSSSTSISRSPSVTSGRSAR